MGDKADLCSVRECAAAGKLAGHRGSHKGQKPGAKAPNDRGASGVHGEKPPLRMKPESYKRSWPPGVQLHVSTSISFFPALLVEVGAVVEINGVRAKVTDYDPEVGDITAEVID